MEIWKSVLEFENYYVISNTGALRSLHHRNLGKVLKTRIDRANYYTVRLTKKMKTCTKYIHRLLAENFIPNPDGKSFVNHINGNQLDNRLCNLEWSTHSENIKHAYDTGLIHKKGKLIIDACSGKMFVSIKEASNIYGINPNTLRNYLNGGIKINPTCLQYHKN